MYKATLISRCFNRYIFHFRESTFSDLAPSLVICLYVYISICTPPPPSLPSTILSSEQGEKVNIKTYDYSPLKRGWPSQINNIYEGKLSL